MTPEDTSRRHPAAHLLGMLADGQSAYIEEMEADGQRQLVASEALPAEAPWEELEALGFRRGDPARDDLFVNATLPPDWRMVASDHPMWSHVVDERGVERVAIFYKAAFYDRRAHASIINVGRAAATKAIYGDVPVGLPAQWDLLTAEEREGYRAALTSDLDTMLKYEETGDRLTRVRTLLELAQ